MRRGVFFPQGLDVRPRRRAKRGRKRQRGLQAFTVKATSRADALRAAANADDAGDDKTHGLVTRALHRLGALRPAVVAAAAL